MVGVDKNKLPKKKVTKKPVKESVKKSAPKSTKPAASAKKSMAEADAKIAKFKEMKAAEKAEKAAEVMHKKTHQDLINAAYKAAEELKIAPWVLLRAASWGHFTEDRGKLYDGPMIDDIEGLDDEQKKALKKAVDL